MLFRVNTGQLKNDAGDDEACWHLCIWCSMSQPTLWIVRRKSTLWLVYSFGTVPVNPGGFHRIIVYVKESTYHGLIHVLFCHKSFGSFTFADSLVSYDCYSGWCRLLRTIIFTVSSTRPPCLLDGSSCERLCRLPCTVDPPRTSCQDDGTSCGHSQVFIRQQLLPVHCEWRIYHCFQMVLSQSRILSLAVTLNQYHSFHSSCFQMHPQENNPWFKQ